MNVVVIVCDTLRLDHCGAYSQGRPLSDCWSQEQPAWAVPTPNMDRLAERGTVFDNCWSGSYPTMPSRRDIHTGRYEFLWRGWGPLEEDDLDLARQVSGNPSTRSIQRLLEEEYSVSYFASDNLNFWRQGSGNYHMGYTGFEFIRGNQEDPWYTDPVDEFFCPETERGSKLERYFRNISHYQRPEEEQSYARLFLHAAEWLKRNHSYEDFYLYVDSFAPHEPWYPPEDLLKTFDPKGYDVEGWTSHPPYALWRDRVTEEQFNSYRARYAASVMLVDRWLGVLLDAMDEMDLWKNTLVIFTTDHGTFNGDHGRIGKNQTHLHDALGHIPFIAVHPEYGRGERRSQLVQLLDIYPTTLAAVGKDVPADLHGVDFLPALEDPRAPIRDYAMLGSYARSVTITDGEWILHQAPVEGNQPLYWYGHYRPRSPRAGASRFADGRWNVAVKPYSTPTWLSNKRDDPNELVNLADTRPEKLHDMQKAFKRKLAEVEAPEEQLDRLGLRDF